MHTILKLSVILSICVLSMGMGRSGQYDEEARDFEKMEKEYNKAGYDTPASDGSTVGQMAGGVKQATYDSTKGLLQDTAEGTAENPPVVGTVQGVMKGSGKVLENTSKGIAEVVTLGRADRNSFRVEEPEDNSEDTTKVKFNF